MIKGWVNEIHSGPEGGIALDTIEIGYRGRRASGTRRRPYRTAPPRSCDS